MNRALSALRFFLIMSLLTGVVYPVLVTVTSQILFPKQSMGSLITRADQIIGSELIGQQFLDPSYFWSRPSAVDYNPIASGATNLGPTSRDLQLKYEEQKKRLSVTKESVPQDLLFASASGLDPHISPMAAKFQLSRIGRARRLSESQLKELDQLIDAMVENRVLGILGEERINVLKLNMKLNER